MEGGKQERDLIKFDALARSRLPSRPARNSIHLILLASFESRLTPPHGLRYSYSFECVVHLIAPSEFPPRVNVPGNKLDRAVFIK